MKLKLIFTYLALFLFANVFGQCDFVIPPTVKKVSYAKRKFTFSDVKINGLKTNFLKVKKGQRVTIETFIEAKKEGDFCPKCIVQVYWGINGYTSVCANSFVGYTFGKKKTKHTFNAPEQEGIYYVTFGGSLEYKCKNNNNRPECSSDYAFAVLQVGFPKDDKNIMLTRKKVNKQDVYNVKLLKNGCFRELNSTQWYFNGKKTSYVTNQIPLLKTGTYTVKMFNCNDSIKKSFFYEYVPTTINNEVDSGTSQDLNSQINTSKKFVLEELVFDQGKSVIKNHSKNYLNTLAKLMLDNPSMRILLEGHTDYRGSARRNQKLSYRRVKAVKRHLTKQGIQRNRIELIGWGEKKPIIIDDDYNKRSKNRRVEITILSR